MEGLSARARPRDGAKAAPPLPGTSYEVPNFRSLIAAKSVTSPPTRLVA